MPLHTRTSPLLRASFAVVLTAVCGSLTGGNPELSATTPPQQTRTFKRATALPPGKNLPVILLGNEVHLWQVRLRRGDAFNAVVDPSSIDVKATLLSPGGTPILAVDTSQPQGQEQESVRAVAGEPGIYTVRVEALALTDSGLYNIQLTPPRPADRKDRLLAKVARLFWEGKESLKKDDEGSRQKARSNYQRVLVILREFGEDPERAEVLARQYTGEAWLASGDGRQAITSFDEAVEACHRLGDLNSEPTLLELSGNAYRILGEEEKARSAYKSASVLARARSLKEEELNALDSLARVYEASGEAQRALEVRKQILERAREEPKDLHHEMWALMELGVFYSSHVRLDESMDYLLEALDIGRRINDDKWTASAYNLIGWVYFLAGNHNLAIAFYDQAIPLHRNSGFDRGLGGALDRKGSALLALGRPAEALAHYLQALEIFKDIDNETDQANTLSSIGRIYDMQGNVQRAREFWLQALSFFQQRGYRENEASALLGLALAERHAGHPQQALSLVREAIDIIESQRAGVGQEKLRISYSSSRYGYYEILIDLLMQLHRSEPDHGYDIEAFEASDRSRARTLLENLAAAEIDKPRNPALLEREKVLETQLVSAVLKVSELRDQDRPREEIAAADRSLRSLQNQWDALRSQNGPLPSTSPHIAHLSEIQATLDDETVILEYALLPEKSYLWVIGRNSFESYELEGRKKIEDLSRKVYDLISENSKAVASRERADLADLVVGPALPQLRGKRLLVVPDGALHLIPFQALRIPTQAGSERIDMIDEHEVYDLPSASVAVELRRKLAGRQPAPGLLAILADAVFNAEDSRLGRNRREESLPPDLERALAEVGLDDLPRLQGSRKEALEILALLPPGEQARLALDFAANRGFMRSDRLSQYRYLHLAVHGILDPEQPELSSLVFSRFNQDGSERNGFVWAYEIYDLDLPAELVVLSACRTAVGREFRGEGPMSLGRAFLHAGAARVIVSRWNVNDSGAAGLMKTFYEGLLRKNLRPGEALRNAQRETKRDPKRSAPYYWAVFSLQGEWN